MGSGLSSKLGEHCTQQILMVARACKKCCVPAAALLLLLYQVVKYIQLECLVPINTPGQQQQLYYVHKYSMVWHDIYRVPVLYIAAARPGRHGADTAAGMAVLKQHSWQVHAGLGAHASLSVGLIRCVNTPALAHCDSTFWQQMHRSSPAWLRKNLCACRAYGIPLVGFLALGGCSVLVGNATVVVADMSVCSKHPPPCNLNPQGDHVCAARCCVCRGVPLHPVRAV
jgi:hypothetical protein